MKELTEAADLIRQAGVKIREAASQMNPEEKSKLGTLNNHLCAISTNIGLIGILHSSNSNQKEI